MMPDIPQSWVQSHHLYHHIVKPNFPATTSTVQCTVNLYLQLLKFATSVFHCYAIQYHLLTPRIRYRLPPTAALSKLVTYRLTHKNLG